MNYKKYICETLLNRYEQSRMIRVENKKDALIRLYYNQTDFPDYVNEKSFMVSKEIERITKALAKDEWVVIQWNRNDKIHSVTLVIDHIEDIYHFCKWVIPTKSSSPLLDQIEPYIKSTGIAQKLALDVQDKVNSLRSFHQWADHADQLLEILTILDHLQNQEVEINVRKFAVRCCQDIRKFERLKPKIKNIISELLDVPEEYALDYFNVTENPSMISFSGQGKLKINNQNIDLKKLDVPLTLGTSAIHHIEIKSLDVNRIILVESVNTFYDMHDYDDLIIHIGGFINDNKMNFLKILHQTHPKIPFYYFGDLNIEGLQLFHSIRTKTKINMQPYLMSVEVLKVYEDLAQPCTLDEMSKLRLMLDDIEYSSLHQTIEYMLIKNIKLKQENIDL